MDDAVAWAKRVGKWRRDRTGPPLPFAVLGDSAIRLVTKYQADPQKPCAKCGQKDADRMCEACGSMFHSSTCIEGEQTLDWLCSKCMDDERYVYEHYAWGPAGATLLRLARVFGGVQDEGLEAAWAANNKLVETAVAQALDDAMSEGTQFDEHQKALIASRAATSQEPLKEIKQRREAERQRHHLALMGVHVDDKMERLIQTGTFNFEEFQAREWATRHFCEPIIAALETANRGLANALVTSLRERDVLLGRIKALEEKSAEEKKSVT